MVVPFNQHNSQLDKNSSHDYNFQTPSLNSLLSSQKEDKFSSVPSTNQQQKQEEEQEEIKQSSNSFISFVGEDQIEEIISLDSPTRHEQISKAVKMIRQSQFEKIQERQNKEEDHHLIINRNVIDSR